jgi:hypothetical protein
MPLDVEITTEPGLEDLLTSDVPASDEAIMSALADFRESTQIEGTPLGAELDELLTFAADATGEGARGWSDPIGDWFARKHQRVVDTEERPIEIAAYWLTLPPGVSGASATVTAAAATSGEASASFKIAGIGGGGTFTVDVKNGIGFTSTVTQRAALSVSGTFDIVEVAKAGKTTRYARLRKLDLANREWTIAEHAPPSPAEAGTPIGSETITASSDQVKVSTTLSIDKETVWQFGLDLTFEKLGLEASLGGKGSYGSSVEYAYELPGGHAYKASRYTGFPAFLWS